MLNEEYLQQIAEHNDVHYNVILLKDGVEVANYDVISDYDFEVETQNQDFDEIKVHAIFNDSDLGYIYAKSIDSILEQWHKLDTVVNEAVNQEAIYQLSEY